MQWKRSAKQQRIIVLIEGVQNKRNTDINLPGYIIIII